MGMRKKFSYHLPRASTINPSQIHLFKDNSSSSPQHSFSSKDICETTDGESQVIRLSKETMGSLKENGIATISQPHIVISSSAAEAMAEPELQLDYLNFN